MQWACVFVALLATVCGSAQAAAPKNVILFIGDGMGAEQIEAAGYFFNGQQGQFSFEKLDHFAWMTTNLSTGGLTDSAAAGTAMATGFKVNSDVVSVALASGPDPRSAAPSDGRPLLTLLEQFAAQGKRTGLVTTSYLTDATPGAFGAHVSDRSQTAGIASGYLSGSRPDVLLGGGGFDLTPAAAALAGYQVVSNRTQLQSVDPAITARVAGLFGTGQFPFAYDQSVGSISFYDQNPYLHEMTSAALDVLSRDPDGFFLMVENELTDAGGHLPVSGPSKLERTIHEVREMSLAVQKARDFAAAHPDTLVIVTSDHETGGFNTVANNGINVLPTSITGDTRHNATMVPVYASGPNAGHVVGILDNTRIPQIAVTNDAEPNHGALTTVSFRQGVDGYGGATDAQLSTDSPNATNLSLPQLTVSQNNLAHMFVRFRNAFGEGKVPLDASIVSAKLSIYTGNAASNDGSAREMLLHRLLVAVDENTTFNNAGNVAGNGLNLNGADASDDDYLAQAESIFPEPSRNAVVTFDVTSSLMIWLAQAQAGQSDELGWVIFNSGTDGWRPMSSEASELAYRPLLEVTFAVVPEPGVAALGTFALLLRRRR